MAITLNKIKQYSELNNVEIITHTEEISSVEIDGKLYMLPLPTQKIYYVINIKKEVYLWLSTTNVVGESIDENKRLTFEYFKNGGNGIIQKSLTRYHKFEDKLNQLLHNNQ